MHVSNIFRDVFEIHAGPRKLQLFLLDGAEDDTSQSVHNDDVRTDECAGSESGPVEGIITRHKKHYLKYNKESFFINARLWRDI